MKAFKITNSINILLNEDKFAKYSRQQIIDELGEDDFIEYLSNTALKIIKNIEVFKNVKTKISNNYGQLTIGYYAARNGFEIICYLSALKQLYIKCFYNGFNSFGRDIDENDPNFSTRLKEEITRCFDVVKDKK